MFPISNTSDTVNQRVPTGGPRAISGLRPLVTRPAKLFVNVLPVATSSLIFFTPKDSKKKSQFLHRLLLCVQMPHMLMTLKPCRKSVPGKDCVGYKLLQEQI
jgi:hypothetical protein